MKYLVLILLLTITASLYGQKKDSMVFGRLIIVLDFTEDGYKKYQNLSDRGKHIVDSLQDAGITEFNYNYLHYEPIYMKEKKKTEWFWEISVDIVVLYQYFFWNNGKGHGFRMVKNVVIQ